MSNITLTSEPTLLDFLIVCDGANEDQRKHFSAMTGIEWDTDGAAIGNFTVPGPKWAIHIGGKPVAVGGFVQQRPGVYRDFFIYGPEAFEKGNYLAVTRICRRIMDGMLAHPQCHRLEMIAPAPRVDASPGLAKWYKILGYNKEGLHYGYCANGADAVSYSRVKH